MSKRHLATKYGPAYYSSGRNRTSFLKRVARGVERAAQKRNWQAEVDEHDPAPVSRRTETTEG